LDAILGLSSLEAQAHKPDHALMLCYFVLNHPTSEIETQCRADGLRATLEPALSPAQVEAVRTAAQGKSLVDIVKDALESV
jgi:hypothetical protein